MLFNFEEPNFTGTAGNCIKVKLATLHHKFVFQRPCFEFVIATHCLQVPKFKEQVLIFTTSNQIPSLEFAQSQSADWLVVDIYYFALLSSKLKLT
jgi:hypothetical protein